MQNLLAPRYTLLLRINSQWLGRAGDSPPAQHLGSAVQRREVGGAELVLALAAHAEPEAVELWNLQGASVEGQHPAACLGPLVAGHVEAVGAEGAFLAR